MSLNKKLKIINFCFITSTLTTVIIAIFLVPISRKAAYWNRCLDKTVKWINENEKDLNDWSKEAKESLAVAVCNGAVYEPRFQTIK